MFPDFTTADVFTAVFLFGPTSLLLLFLLWVNWPVLGDCLTTSGLAAFAAACRLFFCARARLAAIKRHLSLGAARSAPATAAPNTSADSASTQAESKRLRAERNAARSENKVLVKRCEGREADLAHAYRRLHVVEAAKANHEANCLEQSAENEEKFVAFERELRAVAKENAHLRKEVGHWTRQASRPRHRPAAFPFSSAPAPFFPSSVAAETTIVDQKSTIESLESTVIKQDLEIKKLQEASKNVPSSSSSPAIDADYYKALETTITKQESIIGSLEKTVAERDAMIEQMSTNHRASKTSLYNKFRDQYKTLAAARKEAAECELQQRDDAHKKAVNDYEGRIIDLQLQLQQKEILVVGPATADESSEKDTIIQSLQQQLAEKNAAMGNAEQAVGAALPQIQAQLDVLLDVIAKKDNVIQHLQQQVAAADAAKSTMVGYINTVAAAMQQNDPSLVGLPEAELAKKMVAFVHEAGQQSSVVGVLKKENEQLKTAKEGAEAQYSKFNAQNTVLLQEKFDLQKKLDSDDATKAELELEETRKALRTSQNKAQEAQMKVNDFQQSAVSRKEFEEERKKVRTVEAKVVALEQCAVGRQTEVVRLCNIVAQHEWVGKKRHYDAGLYMHEAGEYFKECQKWNREFRASAWTVPEELRNLGEVPPVVPADKVNDGGLSMLLGPKKRERKDKEVVRNGMYSEPSTGYRNF